MATKAKKTEKFSPGKYVVHPFHGAAKIIRKVNKNVSIFVDGEPKSKRIEYYEIEILFDGLILLSLSTCATSPEDTSILKGPAVSVLNELSFILK